MKKKLLAVLLGLSLLGSVTVTYAMGIVCPHCGMGNCMWTGETQTDAYGMFLVYRCINGHEFLVRQ